MTNMVAKNHSLDLDKLVNLFRDSMCTFVQSLKKMTKPVTYKPSITTICNKFQGELSISLKKYDN